MNRTEIKVLHLSSFDVSGGAARAAYRIHQGLQSAAVDSQMLVQYKKGSDRAVHFLEGKVRSRLRSSIDNLPLKLYPNCEHWFSPQWFPDAIETRVKQINPDVINLNWVCNGFLRVETLAKFNKPIVWTLQDMWAFTGGCHYSYGCKRYQESCGDCPQLRSGKIWDLSSWIYQRKVSAWKDLNLTIVAPSLWMAECARSSSLFRGKRVEVIPFGLDTKIFKPIEKNLAREQLNLPQDKQLVLFGAIDAISDVRKGFNLLKTALKELSQTKWKECIELVIFGADKPEKSIDLGFSSHYLGSIKDDLLLRSAYAAADVMIAPSIEEAYGQIASESLACGTPVVVFDNTGLADIVDHKKNGYIANHCDAEDLAKGITWILEDKERHQILCFNACQKAKQEFTLKVQAQCYLSLFNEVLSKKKPIKSD
jgi:glycosyltransferase involved in cell wall biosynthesis